MIVTITGLGNLEDYFEDLLDAADLEKAMQQSCKVIERKAKQKAPKGHSDLRRSIQSEVEKDDNEIVGTVFSPLEYAPYVEYGTGLFAEEEGRSDVPWSYYDDETDKWYSTYGMKPQPYLRPALIESKAQVIKILSGGLVND